MMKIYLLIAGITSIMAIAACTNLVNSQQTASHNQLQRHLQQMQNCILHHKHWSKTLFSKKIVA